MTKSSEEMLRDVTINSIRHLRDTLLTALESLQEDGRLTADDREDYESVLGSLDDSLTVLNKNP